MTNLSYDHGLTRTPLRGMTIGANLAATVRDHGPRDALVAPRQNVRLSYDSLWQLTGQVAQGLIAHGVDRGDRVAIWAPNRYEWVVVQYAVARIGAVLVNVNPAYKSDELRHALVTCDVSILIHAATVRGNDLREILNKVRNECRALRHVFTCEDGINALVDAGQTVSEQELAERESHVHFDDVADIQYTSGTTGTPKAVMLTHHALLNNGWEVGEAVNYTEHDRVCIPVPFFHAFGMMLGNLACTSHGAAIVIPDENFQPSVTLQTVQDEKCTSLYGVPTMFISELALPDFVDYDLRSLRTGIMAGAPCPIEVMRQVQAQMMSEVVVMYGMTETGIVTHTRHDDPVERQVSTIGRVIGHNELSIVDPSTGAVVARWEVGEICIRGYSVTPGYWGDSQSTDRTIDANRWLHTGDLGVMDDDGYITISGRNNDMIIRGGENIYPKEIEDLLYTHPAVEEAQVIGIPSELYGEEVMAWIRLDVNANSISATDIEEFCRGKIATYKIPRFWRFVTEFPMTSTGKIQKYRMREMSTAAPESR